MIVCLSGRGDKDVVQVKDRLEQEREESKMGKTLTGIYKKLKDQQQRDLCSLYHGRRS